MLPRFQVAFSDDGTKVVAFDQEGRDHQVNVFPGGDAELVNELRKHNVQFAVVPPPEANPAVQLLSGFGGLLINFLPLFLLIGLNILSRVDSALVMEGPPGTGKTLLARAVAGEAGVPLHLGVGLRVRRDVRRRRRRARARPLRRGQEERAVHRLHRRDRRDRPPRAGGGGGGMGGGNDEREQTLNQILTEMDGFEGNSGVIVLAATNRADVLDAALIRPGRFDRRVPVDLPDVKGPPRDPQGARARQAARRGRLDLDIVAKRTTGFSGASLANLMNEAAIVAARNDKTEIGYEEIDYAIDRQTVGMQKTTGTSFPNRQRLVAYHEAGHALMGLLTPDYDMVTKVTIMPRTNGAGGFTLFTPTEERLESGLYSKRYLEGQLAVALGGRVAEEIVYGEDEMTTGASNDLQQVRNDPYSRWQVSRE